jgi:hypothetical protein
MWNMGEIKWAGRSRILTNTAESLEGEVRENGDLSAFELARQLVV